MERLLACTCGCVIDARQSWIPLFSVAMPMPFICTAIQFRVETDDSAERRFVSEAMVCVLFLGLSVGGP